MGCGSSKTIEVNFQNLYYFLGYEKIKKSTRKAQSCIRPRRTWIRKGNSVLEISY